MKCELADITSKFCKFCWQLTERESYAAQSVSKGGNTRFCELHNVKKSRNAYKRHLRIKPRFDELVTAIHEEMDFDPRYRQQFRFDFSDSERFASDELRLERNIRFIAFNMADRKPSEIESILKLAYAACEFLSDQNFSPTSQPEFASLAGVSKQAISDRLKMQGSIDLVRRDERLRWWPLDDFRGSGYRFSLY